MRVAVGDHLLLGHQLGQRPRERVDLVRVQFGAVAQLRRFVGEEALQPEQQEKSAPANEGPRPRVDLAQARRARAGRSGRGLGPRRRAEGLAAPRRFGAAPLRCDLVGGDLLLGHQLGQRAGEGVDLVRVELGPVAQLRRFVGEQPLEPEQQREVAAPLDRGVLGALVELLQRGVERAPARGAGRQRLGPLAVEQEGLAGERRRALDVGA